MSKQSEYLRALGRGQSDTRHFFVFLKRRQTKEGSWESRAGKKGHHVLGVCVLVVARLQCVICLSLDVTHLHNPVLGGRELSLDRWAAVISNRNVRSSRPSHFSHPEENVRT